LAGTSTCHAASDRFRGLLTHEMAESPIPEDLEFLRAIVVRRHEVPPDAEQCEEAPQLSLEVNDIVYVLEQDESGWWGGHKEGQENVKGWFPGNCVRALQDESVSMLDPWGGGVGTLPEEPAEDDDDDDEDKPYEEPPIVGGGRDLRQAGNGAMRLSTPTFPGAVEDNTPAAPVSVATNASVSSSASAQRPSQGSGDAYQAGGMSSAEVAANTQELAKAKEEIARLQAELDRVKQHSQATINMLQTRSQEEAAAAKEYEKQMRSQSDKAQGWQDDLRTLKEELQRSKRDSQVQASELRTYYEQQLQQKDVECNKKIADVNARYDSLLEEMSQAPGPADSRTYSQPVPAARSSVVEEPSADDLKRRLFPSTVSEHPAAVRSTPVEVTPSEMNKAFVMGATFSQASTARCLPTPMNSEPVTPVEVQKNAALRSVGYTNDVPGFRSPSRREQEPANVNSIDRDETPPRGTVRAKVSQFEQRCSTPQRDALHRGGEPVPTPMGHPSRNRRGQSPVPGSRTEAYAMDPHSTTPPTLPKGVSLTTQVPPCIGSPTSCGRDVDAAAAKVCLAAAARTAPAKMRDFPQMENDPNFDNDVPLVETIGRCRPAGGVPSREAMPLPAAAKVQESSYRSRAPEPVATDYPSISMEASNMQSPTASRELSVKERIAQMRLR